MPASRLLLVLLPIAAVAIAFWLLLLGPKRQEASELQDSIASLRGEVEEQEQAAFAAEEARKEFPTAYRRLVVLGKAAPVDDDTASLLYQLSRTADATGVKFLAVTADQSQTAAAAPPPAEPETPADAAEESEQQVAAAESGDPAAAPVAAAPTEATAATLPIGASVGPAGLPVMKYELGFEGKFFRLSDFLAGIDDMVRTEDDGWVGVRGRLITIDGFEIEIMDGQEGRPDPRLEAKFTVTTYLTPPEEGVTAGASPAGPPPPGEPQPVTSEPAADPGATASTATP